MIAKCKFCLNTFEAKRSTASFCTDSHRVMFSKLSDEEKKEKENVLALEYKFIPKPELVFREDLIEKLKEDGVAYTLQQAVDFLTNFYLVNDHGKKKMVDSIKNSKLFEKKVDTFNDKINDSVELPEPTAYQFGDEKYINVEAYTKYPLKNRPTTYAEAIEWDKKRKLDLQEIKTAWYAKKSK